jgi:hypothetical protein
MQTPGSSHKHCTGDEWVRPAEAAVYQPGSRSLSGGLVLLGHARGDAKQAPASRASQTISLLRSIPRTRPLAGIACTITARPARLPAERDVCAEWVSQLTSPPLAYRCRLRV